MSSFALKILDAAGCGRRQGSAMNSLRSALTAVLADPKIHRSGRRGTAQELAWRRAILRGTTVTQNRGHCREGGNGRLSARLFRNFFVVCKITASVAILPSA